MKELLIAVILPYSIIAIIDIIRVIRRFKKVNLTRDIRKTLMVHMLGALILPPALTLLLVSMKNFDIKYLFVACLIGVWISLFSTVTLFLDDVAEKKVQASD